MPADFATRDDFFSATKRRFKAVTLWNGKKARIRSLNEVEYALIDATNLDFKRGGLSKAGIRESNVRLLVASVCDGEGNLLFGEADLPQLGLVDTALIEPLVREIREHCGLKNLDQEELEKNSPATTGGDSDCSSVGPSPTG